MNTFVTLHRLRQHLGFAAADTSEDSRLLTLLEAATALLERGTQRRFTPRHATIAHSFNLYDAAGLLLQEDLLALTGLINGDGSSLSLSSTVILPGELRLINGACFVYESTPLNAIDVTGIWGWHDDWLNAWRSSGDTVQNNPLSATSTALTVADADGADAENEVPRFQVGQLLKIEDEYLRVLAVNTTTNVLTVLRGVNGTTAASHAQNVAISIYQPPHDAALVCLRLAAWLYREPDNEFGQNMPGTLATMLYRLRRVRV
jgi:hypothetical protein